MNKLRKHLKKEHDKKQAWSNKNDQTTSESENSKGQTMNVTTTPKNVQIKDTKGPINQSSKNEIPENQPENSDNLTSSPPSTTGQINLDSMEEGGDLSKNKKNEDCKIGEKKLENLSETLDKPKSSPPSPMEENKHDTKVESSDLSEAKENEDCKIGEEKLENHPETLNKPKSGPTV